MLGIILGILKVIGCIILSLLVLLLLIVIAVLFVPVRYCGTGNKHKEDIQGRIKVSWLLHLLTVTVSYSEREMSMRIGILGISLDSFKKFFAQFKKIRKKKARQKDSSDEIAEPPYEKKPVPQLIKAEEEKDSKEIKESEDIKNSKEKKDLKEKKDSKEITNNIKEQIQEQIQIQDRVEEHDPIESEGFIEEAHITKGKEPSVFEKVGNAIKAFFRRIKDIWLKLISIPEKIKKSFRKFRLTIKGFYDKIKEWKKFMDDTRTKNAFRLAKKKLLLLLKHILPKKIKGEVRFGFEDPALTGQALAAAAVFYPVYGKHIQIYPHFDQVILEGKLFFKGRIYISFLLKQAWELYKDKNIKFIIKKFKSKEE